MGIKGAKYYVYRLEKLGLRTNVEPELWEGDIDAFLEACPMNCCIGFNIDNNLPIEIGRYIL